LSGQYRPKIQKDVVWNPSHIDISKSSWLPYGGEEFVVLFVDCEYGGGLGCQKTAHIAAAPRVFDDPHERFQGKRLLQTHIEEWGQLFIAIAVTRHGGKKGPGEDWPVQQRQRDGTGVDAGEVFVQENEFKSAGMEQFQRSLSVVRHNGAVTNAVEQENQTVRDELIIVDDEHIHSISLLREVRGAAKNASYVIKYY
jgi:hypothetical protein